MGFAHKYKERALSACKTNIIKIFFKFFLALVITSSLINIAVSAPYEDPDDKDFNLILNGASYHFKRASHNEKNYGLGFSYKLKNSNLRPSFLENEPLYFELDVFKDSFSDTGYAGAIAWKRPLSRHSQYGLKVGLLRSEHSEKQFGMPVIPYAVPFLETNFEYPVNLRTTLIPPFRDVTYGYLMFQLIVKTD